MTRSDVDVRSHTCTKFSSPLHGEQREQPERDLVEQRAVALLERGVEQLAHDQRKGEAEAAARAADGAEGERAVVRAQRASRRRAAESGETGARRVDGAARSAVSREWRDWSRQRVQGLAAEPAAARASSD